MNLPAPKLNKKAPISIPEKKFKALLGTFRTCIPDTLVITANDTSPRKSRSKTADLQREIAALSTKIPGTQVPETYLFKTLEPLVAAHPQRGSLHVILGATFLIVSSWKDGVRRKITGQKRVLEVFDGEFTNRQLNDWIGIIERELEESQWFERNPVAAENRGTKRGIDVGEGGDVKKRTVKNISGVGIMVCCVVCFRVLMVDAPRGGVWGGETSRF